MNLFKKDPIKFFQVICAISLVVFAYLLVLYFVKIEYKKPSPQVTSQKNQNNENIGPNFVNPNAFGVVNVKLESPSYAHSNFDINPAGDIVIYFNKKLNFQSMYNKINLVKYSTGKDAVFTSVYKTNIGASDTQTSTHAMDQKDNAGNILGQDEVILKLNEPLETNTLYRLTVKSGYSDANLESTSAYDFYYDFNTADSPGLINSNINPNTEVPIGKPLILYFRSPMDNFEMKSKIKITPLVKNLSVLDQDKAITINGDLEPNTEYNILIPETTKDIFGRALGTPIDITFRTSVVQ